MTHSPKQQVNNAIYSQLGQRWYDADDDPIALLRAESRLRNPWIRDELSRRFGRACMVLDVGCGAGFLSNDLGDHLVTGIDASEPSLAIARQHDRSGRVRYDLGDATRLPYADASFDAVCAMDFLEHVEQPAEVIAEIGRVLKPDGVFFFHTFNRNWLAWLIVIKGVEWLVRNTPRDLHVLRLFLTPDEVSTMCQRHGLDVVSLIGMRPCIDGAFVRLITTGRIVPAFRFTFTRSTRLAYCGIATKPNRPRWPY